MIKTLIIDDEPLARSLILEYLAPFAEIDVVQECGDGFQALKAINDTQPQLIFLDVQMPKINGFELLELLDQPPLVIFTTAFEEYAIKAFEAQALDYLLKPFSQDRFEKAIYKCLEKIKAATHESQKDLSPHGHFPQPEEQNRIVVKNGSTIKIIPVQEVLYLEAFDDYVKIITKEGNHLKKKTLSHYESVLNPRDFQRVHRSFLVNLQKISRIEPFEKNSHIAILVNGVKVPLSRAGYLKLKETLGV
jgi:two-component system LytT family response regulator